MTNLKLFSEIYAKNYPDVVNIVNWRINDANFAQDIAQEVFIKVFRFYDDLYVKEKSDFRTWLFNITKNCVIDFVRKNRYERNCINISNFVNDNDDDEQKIFFQFVDKNASADKYINNKELSNKISNAFSTLNEGKERLIAHLYFIEEYEYKEIEELTMYPMGTIKGMINRIRTKLQTQLVA
jgi:RNA polymerase sigma factor (sigma-70 family)